VSELDPPKPPEPVSVDGKPALKVYICLPCAKVLQGRKAAMGGVLEYVDLAWLCPACRANSTRDRRGED